MKLFKCQHCGQVLYFENRSCGHCGHRLGYVAEAATLSALEPDDEAWRRVGAPDRRYRFCANEAFDVCNWLIPAGQTEPLCLCCRHNRTVPDTGIEANVSAWRRLEAAKHRLFYSLLKLRLPLENRADAPDDGLAFDFPAALPNEPRVMTGHDNGVITIALDEADDVEREKQRTMMHEPYRTLLGHFRHEVGHYFWDRLLRDETRLEACRAVFGDERADYGAALKAHYENGPPANWPDNFVSAYASAHPWEDFAETWAHYLHIVDTLEMAGALGMEVNPRLDKSGTLDARVDFDPYAMRGMGQIIDAWVPFSVALNCLNRTMGLADAYPFVLSPMVIGKLGFINDLAHKPAAAPANRG
jgi:hypothetical protein